MSHSGDSGDSTADPSQGRKISEFPADTVLPADTELSFISDSTNFKITLANFLTALNVTGSIASIGDGIPLYTLAGSVNQIRALETLTGLYSEQGTSGNVEISDGFIKTITDDTPYQVIQSSEVIFCETVSEDAFVTLRASPQTGDLVRLFNTGTSQDIQVFSSGSENLIYQGTSTATGLTIGPLRSVTFRRAPAVWIQENYD